MWLGANVFKAFQSEIADEISLPLGEGGQADCAETDEVFTGIGNDIIHRWGGPYNVRQAEVDPKWKAQINVRL